MMISNVGDVRPMNEGAKSRAATANPCEACSVRELSVCGVLSSRELERLDGIVTKSNFAPLQMIFGEGDDAASLFNVTNGVVKVYKLLADGRRQITGFLFPGDFLGLALHDTYNYSAEAITSVSVCRFPRPKLEKLMEELPHLEKRLLRGASNELAAAQDQMLLLGRKSASERVATFLVTLYQRAQRRGAAEGPRLELPISRADMADYLGLTIETVSRTFTKLKKEGIIALPQTHMVELANMESLEDLSGIEIDDQIEGSNFL